MSQRNSNRSRSSFRQQAVPSTLTQSNPGVHARHLWAFTIAAGILAFLLYAPALDGPFLFDDFGLPFYVPSAARETLKSWVSGVRPILMLSYWVNYQLSGADTWTYHAFNVLLHVFNSGLVFLLLTRLLRLRAVDDRQSLIYCAGAAVIFLVHPLQTEAVAYVAGRSELLCSAFALGALVVYSDPTLSRVSWLRAISVIALYCAAVLSKEQAVVLPAAFLVIDTLFRQLSFRETFRRGARLYCPILVIGAMAAVGVFLLLARSSTAGFGIPGVSWRAYLLTQFRVWLLYMGLAVFPVGQNPDYDIALSHSFGDHGSFVALAILLGMGFAAWCVRERFPLLFGGAMIFAILLAPTSSVVPIQDVAAERRMYLPLVGLLLVVIELLFAANANRRRLAVGILAYSVVCAALTHERAKVWNTDISFWSNVTSQSPEKVRGYAHLAYAYLRQRRCTEAIDLVARAPEGVRRAPEVLSVVGHAYSCKGRMRDAIDAFERAAAEGPGPGRVLTLAQIYRRAGRVRDAEIAERQALMLPPRTPYDFAMLDAFNRANEQERSRSSDR